MAPFIFLCVVALIIWLIVRAQPSRQFKTPARGILLWVDVFSTRVPLGNLRVERRNMTVDVEIPGREPYEVTTWVLFPTNLVRDILPGAAVELRVNRGDRNKVYIVGLAVGFSAAGLLGPAGATAATAPQS